MRLMSGTILTEMLEGYQLEHGASDIIRWDLEISSQFTTKSLYKKVMADEDSDNSYTYIWK